MRVSLLAKATATLPCTRVNKAATHRQALLRKAAEPTVDGLWDALGHIIDLCTPSECANDFAAAGYEPD